MAYGKPASQGSKRVIRGIMIDDNPEALRNWRDDVKQAAARALRSTPGWDRNGYPAIIGHFAFTLARPQAHYLPPAPTKDRLDKVLKSDAPHLHGSTPDLDKLLRSTFDALTAAGVYPDDRLLAQIHAVKSYAAPAGILASATLDRPGVRIILSGVTR